MPWRGNMKEHVMVPGKLGVVTQYVSFQYGWAVARHHKVRFTRQDSSLLTSDATGRNHNRLQQLAGRLVRASHNL
jgi:hypothetical protein